MKKVKLIRWLGIFAMLALFAGSSACSDSKTDGPDDNGNGNGGTDPTLDAVLLSLTESSWDFSGRWPEAYEIGVTISPVKAVWEAVPDEDWVHITPEHDYFVISLDPNRDGQPRQATITVTGGANKKQTSMIVRQGVIDPLHIDGSEIGMIGKRINTDATFGIIYDADEVYYKWDFTTNAKTALSAKEVFDISNDGNIMVGHVGNRAAYYSDSRWNVLTLPSEDYGLASYLHTMTGDGSKFAGWYVVEFVSETENKTTNRHVPFISTANGSYTDLPVPLPENDPNPNNVRDGFYSNIYNLKMSAKNGRVIVGEEAGRFQSFAWVDDKLLDLPSELYEILHVYYEVREDPSQPNPDAVVNRTELTTYPNNLVVSPEGKYIAGWKYVKGTSANSTPAGTYEYTGNDKKIPFIYTVESGNIKYLEDLTGREIYVIKDDGMIFTGALESGEQAIVYNTITGESITVNQFLQREYGYGVDTFIADIADDYSVCFAMKPEGIGVAPHFFFK